MNARKSKPQIMIVENEPLNMKLVSDLLEINGFETLKAADAETTFKILQDNHPDVILMDINLPGTDGVELYKKIREMESFKNTKIVALTAMAMKEDKERIMKVGFDKYITKPINTKEFIHDIKNMTGSKNG